MKPILASKEGAPFSSTRHYFQTCSCCQPVAAQATRRNFLAGGIAALGLSAGSAPARAQDQTNANQLTKTRVDVHHHYVPPVHAQALARHRPNDPAPKWTLQMTRDDMEQAGVATAILSLVPPAVYFGDNTDREEARKLARACNEYGAQLVRDNPDQFGLFAALPLTDTDGSLREIEYALDTLKADGIGLVSSYGDKYLGDPAFLPVFQELNRRKAVVYTHPLVPVCCGSMTYGMGASSIEFATDTTRTIASLIFGKAGTAFSCPDVRYIWSHSGGTLPFLIGRFTREQMVRKDARMPNGPVPIIQKFFYEVAQGNTPEQLAALTKLVPISQVMFGSDYPYRKAIEAVEGLANYKFDPTDLAAINRDNAVRLLPRLKA